MDDQQRLGELLETVPRLRDRFMDLRDVVPADGSNAAIELAQPLGKWVRVQAIASLSSGLDHLLAWAALFLRARLVTPIAPMTLLRSSVEGTATARWIVDPTAVTRVRMARAIGAQLADLGERKQIERLSAAAATNQWAGDGQPATVRIQRLEEEAAAVGLCPLRITHTDAVARFGPGEGVYRMLCAFAHGGVSIPLAASTVEVLRPDDPNGPVHLEADDARLFDLTELAVAYALRAVSEMFDYHGLSLEEPTSAGGD
jgi:hypothetical protein